MKLLFHAPFILVRGRIVIVQMKILAKMYETPAVCSSSQIHVVRDSFGPHVCCHVVVEMTKIAIGLP